MKNVKSLLEEIYMKKSKRKDNNTIVQQNAH